MISPSKKKMDFIKVLKENSVDIKVLKSVSTKKYIHLNTTLVCLAVTNYTGTDFSMPFYNKINLWHLLYKIHIFTQAEIYTIHSLLSQCWGVICRDLGHDLLPRSPNGVTEHNRLLRT